MWAAIDYSRTRARFDIDGIPNETTDLVTGSFGVEINQMLFDGFQTKNNVAAAEARVRAQQQSLKNTEQNILFDAASAYMDVIRDRQIAVLRQRNLEFLEEQVRAARSQVRCRRRHEDRRCPGRGRPFAGRRGTDCRACHRGSQRCDLPADHWRGSEFLEDAVAAGKTAAEKPQSGDSPGL